MPHYPAIRSFLSNHRGHYCAECLAARLSLPADQIRRILGLRRGAKSQSPTEFVKAASMRRESLPFERAPDSTVSLATLLDSRQPPELRCPCGGSGSRSFSGHRPLLVLGAS